MGAPRKKMLGYEIKISIKQTQINLDIGKQYSKKKIQILKIRAITRNKWKRNLYIKDCIFKSVIWNLIQGASKHKMQSKKLWFTKTLGKLSNQTENAIFTLKIAFSSRVKHASLRHQTTSIPFHMNTVESKKKNHPPTSLSAFRLVL